MQTDFGRYKLSNLIRDANNRLVLDLRARLEFQEMSDDIVHVAQDGDTLQLLAAVYYQGLPNAAALWWAIADYQPEPIQDPTVQLQRGQTIIIPSPAAVQEGLFGLYEEDNIVV